MPLRILLVFAVLETDRRNFEAELLDQLALRRLGKPAEGRS